MLVSLQNTQYFAAAWLLATSIIAADDAVAAVVFVQQNAMATTPFICKYSIHFNAVLNTHFITDQKRKIDGKDGE